MEPVPKKILKGPLRACIALLIIGILFKIQHWPGRNPILVSALSMIAVFYSFRFAKKQPKLFLDHVKLVMVVTWAVGSILRTQHLADTLFLSIIELAAVIIWLVMEGFSYFSPKEEKKELTRKQWMLNTIFALAMIITLTGVAFKIQHWPYASVMLISGLGLGALWFGLGFSIKEK